MSLAADALQPLLVREFRALSGRAPLTRLADILTDGPGSGYDLDFDQKTKSILIDFREPRFIASAIAGDASRFASACFTSLASIVPSIESPVGLAWAMVRMYYAAFYGGHSLLRLLGRSCSQLDQRHVTKLQKLFAASDSVPPFEFGKGLYHCVMNAGQTGLSITPPGIRGGGSHEVFWQIFETFLSDVSDGALIGHLSPAEGVNIFGKFEAVRRIYKRGGGASWLSTVRNDIQYKHLHQVWDPPGVNKTMRNNLARLAGQWTRDPMEIDIEFPPCGELGAFVGACAFTASLCKSVLQRVTERSAMGSRSFASHPLRLCTE
jgi:hypothetical protein